MKRPSGFDARLRMDPMVQLVEKVLRGFSRALGIETPEDLDIKYENSQPLAPQDQLWERDGA
jgi:hypothetical protein